MFSIFCVLINSCSAAVFIWRWIVLKTHGYKVATGRYRRRKWAENCGERLVTFVLWIFNQPCVFFLKLNCHVSIVNLDVFYSSDQNRWSYLKRNNSSSVFIQTSKVLFESWKLQSNVLQYCSSAVCYYMDLSYLSNI